MSLEEKIADLSPRLRDQVEDYVNYLLNKEGSGQISEPSPVMLEAEASDVSCMDDLNSDEKTEVMRPEGRKIASSGIILAEEQGTESLDKDYVDFADINSRFGHLPEGDDDHREPGRLRRLLDWM